MKQNRQTIKYFIYEVLALIHIFNIHDKQAYHIVVISLLNTYCRCRRVTKENLLHTDYYNTPIDDSIRKLKTKPKVAKRIFPRKSILFFFK